MGLGELAGLSSLIKKLFNLSFIYINIPIQKYLDLRIFISFSSLVLIYSLFLKYCIISLILFFSLSTNSLPWVSYGFKSPFFSNLTKLFLKSPSDKFFKISNSFSSAMFLDQLFDCSSYIKFAILILLLLLISIVIGAINKILIIFCRLFIFSTSTSTLIVLILYVFNVILSPDVYNNLISFNFCSNFVCSKYFSVIDLNQVLSVLNVLIFARLIPIPSGLSNPL